MESSNLSRNVRLIGSGKEGRGMLKRINMLLSLELLVLFNVKIRSAAIFVPCESL